MTYWVAMIDSSDRRVLERLTELGLEPWRVPGFGYALVRSPEPPWGALSIDGVLRLLPVSTEPRPLPDDAAEAFMATCRAASHTIAEHIEQGVEPTVAGMARSMLANILRKHGFGVTIAGDRVETVNPPRSGRNSDGHRARRLARQALR